MGTTNGSSNLKAFEDYTGKYGQFSPFALPNPPHDLETNEDGLKSSEGISCHQRCSSESLLIDEQPSWLDDLLNDMDTVVTHRGHRRSASDSFAYFGDSADEAFNSEDESKYIDSFFGPSYPMSFRNVGPSEAKAGLSLAKTNNQGSGGLVEHSREESSLQNPEDSFNQASASHVKPYGSKAVSKRSKQQNAHRSRVRKLQYIAHLERTLQILKVEGSEFSAELEFLEQQNMILTMENRALRQRLESISQEQLIKHWEQGMLEREIGRLQNLYHMQKQQQMQMPNQQPHNKHPKHRRNRSREFDHQMNNGLAKNNDAKPISSNVHFPPLNQNPEC